MNNVGVKSLKTIYDNKKAAPGIRHYMLEHIQSLDKVLADIKQAGATIAGAKSQFCMSGLKMVSYVCNAKRKHSDAAKVIKIFD